MNELTREDSEGFLHYLCPSCLRMTPFDNGGTDSRCCDECFCGNPNSRPALGAFTLAHTTKPMKKLSPERQAEFTKLEFKIKEQYEAVSDALEEFNQDCTERWTRVENLLLPLNETILEAATLQGEVVTDMETYMEDKSDKWTDSDKGSAYAEWLDAWQWATVDQLDILEPDYRDMPDAPEFDREELPTELPEDS